MTKRLALVVLAAICASQATAEVSDTTTVIHPQDGDTVLRHLIQYFVFGLKGSILGF